jgi:ferredoxin
MEKRKEKEWVGKQKQEQEQEQKERRGRERGGAVRFNSLAWAKSRSPQQGACIYYCPAEKENFEKYKEYKCGERRIRKRERIRKEREVDSN